MNLVLIRYIVLILFMVLVSVADIKTNEVPNKILIAAFVVGLICVFISKAPDEYIRAFAGMVLSFAVMLLFYFISKRSLGFGDVKLAAVMGFYLGIKIFICALFYSLLIFIVTGLILTAAKKVNLKTEIPYVPFLTIGLVIEMILIL